jgi:glutathione S-transferase
MAFHYVSTAEAIAADGLRMVVVGGLPSPWGESAKGIFHVKGIDWLAVRLDFKDEALARWAGQQSGPVAIYGQERPRDGWAEILLLAERLTPEPTLLPTNPEERAWTLGLAHELLGEQGLAWTRRLQLVHAGLQERGGFPARVAGYLAKKYGYSSACGQQYSDRVASLLQMLVRRLRSQRASGGYLCGSTLTVADIYCAATMALFRPLAPEVCDMLLPMRAAFETQDEQTAAALDPILFEHRDRVYARHLALPLTL